MTFGTQDLDPERGFDPETQGMQNGRQRKALKAYESLQAQGMDDEAGYLRALVSVDLQAEFAKFLRERDVVSF